MSVSFEFNAPQFLIMSEDPDADKFFDRLHENEVKDCSLANNRTKEALNNKKTSKKDLSSDTLLEGNVKTERLPILRRTFKDLANKQIQCNEDNEEVEKNKPDDNDLEILKGLDKLKINKSSSCKKVRMPVKTTEIFEGIKIEKWTPKQHNMLTRLDLQTETPVLNLRNRQVPLVNTHLHNERHRQDSQNTTSTPDVKEKRVGIKRKASPLSGKKKFVSLAERVQHFHFDTPDRFRTIPKNQVTSQNTKLSQTIPKTPILTAKFRSRPVNFPNRKEREEMELQEIKKNQIKANPVNEKILKGPVWNLKCPVEKKPNTIPEPFKLSEAKRKDQLPSPVFVFKAHPLPSSLLNGPVGVPPKKVAKTTIPWTPKIKQPLRTTNVFEIHKKDTNVESKTILRTTKVQPFSFDPKIKELFRKKEENIRKVIEDEKKAFNSFRAQPLPSFISHGLSDNSSISRHDLHRNLSTMSGGKKETENKINGGTIFKAKPATVVHRKPFTPILPEHETVLPGNIHLNTEKRALERQKFEDKMKKKQEIQAEILRKRKEEEEKLEQKMILEERKLTEFKANPVPRYKTFEILPSDPSHVTLPKTPRFLMEVPEWTNPERTTMLSNG